MMTNPVSSAGGGLVLAAAILFIFVGISNFTLHQVVPRHLRFVEITTGGLGATITAVRANSNPNAVYGNSNADDNQRTIGDGLRIFYTWGLWNRCAGYYGKSDPQYCTDTSWAYKFRPTAALMEDVPNSLKARTSNVLKDQYNSDDYFGAWSRAAFYFIFISACLTGLILIFSLINARGPGRLGSLNLSVLSLLAFITGTLGAVIWTAIVGILRHQLSRDTIGVDAHYGNAIWLLWAINGIMLLASFGYLGGCIRGRKRAIGQS